MQRFVILSAGFTGTKHLNVALVRFFAAGRQGRNSTPNDTASKMLAHCQGPDVPGRQAQAASLCYLNDLPP